MKTKLTLLFLSVLFPWVLVAQTTEAEAALKKTAGDIEEGWNMGGLFSLSFSQVSLTNWIAGGKESVSGAGLSYRF